MTFDVVVVKMGLLVMASTPSAMAASINSEEQPRFVSPVTDWKGSEVSSRLRQGGSALASPMSDKSWIHRVARDDDDVGDVDDNGDNGPVDSICEGQRVDGGGNGFDVVGDNGQRNG